jgi:hypothetical protein
VPKIKKRSSKPRNDVPKQFKALTAYMRRVAQGEIGRHKIYSLCVKASACKCFEFNLAIPSFSKSRNAFFAMATLRGICEDLIVLRFVGKLPSQDRDSLFAALSTHELANRTKLQGIFFSAIRPQQPVLQIEDADAVIEKAEVAARAIWNRHGWPKLARGAMPPIRQIAEKQGLHQLAILYDYLYRLTSAGVHFNVQTLLRSGWGSPKKFVFSPKNFHGYFDSYCAIYGAFMFCLYFEFFQSVLRPTHKERVVIDKIREGVLYASRWPEMVTFEEMNQKPPAEGHMFRVIVSALQAASRKRLIGRGVDYTNRRSAERRSISKLLKIIAQAATSESATPSLDTTRDTK